MIYQIDLLNIRLNAKSRQEKTMSNKFSDSTYLKEIDTEITGFFEENGSLCVKLLDNIHHPHGGGQKGDKGVLLVDGREYKIIDTVKDKYSESEEVLLVISGKGGTAPDFCCKNRELSPLFPGKAAVVKVDWDFRYRQMRLHTAVHLHHCMLEKAAGKQLPPPKTSDIQDGFAFNRYECKEITPELVDSANSLFTNAVSTGAAVKTYADASKKGFRWWESLGFKIPCGGTHVADLGEIGDVTIAYSKKSGKQTVTITLNGDRNETP